MSDIVERLRAERLERQRQRQLELDRLTQESKLMRDQRQKDREAVRDKERQLNQLIGNLTSKTIHDSIQTSKLRSNEQLLEQESAERSARNRNLMRELDRRFVPLFTLESIDSNFVQCLRLALAASGSDDGQAPAAETAATPHQQVQAAPVRILRHRLCCGNDAAAAQSTAIGS